MSEDKIQETIDKYKRCEVWMAFVSAELLAAELMDNIENLKAYATLTKAISDAANGPLDADGETWRVGDMSDSPSGVIEEVDYAEGQWRVRGHGVSPWVPADSLRHWHEPTIKDILTELQSRTIDWCFNMSLDNLSDSANEKAALVEEYADKLREVLKEDKA